MPRQWFLKPVGAYFFPQAQRLFPFPIPQYDPLHSGRKGTGLKKSVAENSVMFLSEKFYKGYGHSPVHLLNKCETCNKNKRESNAVTKFRKALSFSAFLVIFFAFAKSVIATAIVILKPCGFSDILFAFKLAKRIPLGASRVSLRSNITRHRRIITTRLMKL